MRVGRALLGIVLVVLLGLGLPELGAVIAETLHHYVPVFPSGRGPTLPWLYSQHLFQTLLALVAIFVIKRFMPFDAGLRWPPAKTYHLARDPVGRLLRRADDGGGLCAGPSGAPPDGPRLSDHPRQRHRLDILRGRLCRTDRGDSLPLAAGGLSARGDAGKAPARPLRDELGRHHRRRDLRLRAYRQLVRASRPGPQPASSSTPSRSACFMPTGSRSRAASSPRSSATMSATSSNTRSAFR